MSRQVKKNATPAAILEQVVINGDLASLSEADRVKYYATVCSSLGLNPLTKPFDYIKLNGRLILYAKRDCADQLRAIHGVSIKVLSKEEDDSGLYIVSVAAVDKHGRHDEDVGAVNIAGLRGDNRANAIAKAMTKAKRRVTLSICGMGFLDETEVSDIPVAPTVTTRLDDIFPPDAPTGPEVAVQTEEVDPPGGQVPEEEDVDATTAEDRTEAIRLCFTDDGQEPIEFTDSHGWYEEYVLQLEAIAKNEDTPARKRMTELKAFEKVNAKGLDAIPEVGAEALKQKRLALNKALGASK
jgi:hypothetical protein